MPARKTGPIGHAIALVMAGLIIIAINLALLGVAAWIVLSIVKAIFPGFGQ